MEMSLSLLMPMDLILIGRSGLKMGSFQPRVLELEDPNLGAALGAALAAAGGKCFGSTRDWSGLP